MFIYFFRFNLSVIFFREFYFVDCFFKFRKVLFTVFYVIVRSICDCFLGRDCGLIFSVFLGLIEFIV